MQLEDYFDFWSDDDIRLKDTRIGIETVLYAYIHRCQSPAEIAQNYLGLSLEQVHATILYYLNQREQVGRYMERWLNHCLDAERKQHQSSSPLVQQLLHLRASQEAVAPTAVAPISDEVLAG